MIVIENPIILTALIVILVITTQSDIRCHRIANVWTVGGAFVALASRFYTGGISELLYGMGGLLTGLILFLPFYLKGGMAAGDVKLMAAVGSFLGIKLAFLAVAFSLICGSVLGLGYLALHRGLRAWTARYYLIIRMFLLTGNINLSYMPPATNDAANMRFPYAIAISVGTLLTMVYVWAFVLPKY